MILVARAGRACRQARSLDDTAAISFVSLAVSFALHVAFQHEGHVS